MVAPLTAGAGAPTLPGAASHPIVFFDGLCGICNRFVDAVLRADRRGILRFAPLQGETARALLRPLAEDPVSWSMLYLDEEGTHEQSEAALRVCRRLGGVWAIPGLLLFVPRALRDAAYRLIARHRYRWFGRRDACRTPSPVERERFLP